jgi:hypothetical protein
LDSSYSLEKAWCASAGSPLARNKALAIETRNRWYITIHPHYSVFSVGRENEPGLALLAAH